MHLQNVIGIPQEMMEVVPNDILVRGHPKPISKSYLVFGSIRILAESFLYELPCLALVEIVLIS